MVGIAALPISIAVGILRYRLYGIDRLISRTLTYLILTGLLVGVFVGIVVLATRVLPFSSPVAVAASTLAAAALFNPLRRRVQHVVDRRFNRAGTTPKRSLPPSRCGYVTLSTSIRCVANCSSLSIMRSSPPTRHSGSGRLPSALGCRHALNGHSLRRPAIACKHRRQGQPVSVTELSSRIEGKATSPRSSVSVMIPPRRNTCASEARLATSRPRDLAGQGIRRRSAASPAFSASVPLLGSRPFWVPAQYGRYLNRHRIGSPE